MAHVVPLFTTPDGAPIPQEVIDERLEQERDRRKKRCACAASSS